MNNVDSDLEEGEILDDSSSSLDSVKIVRELPRRYIIQKNKDTRIHKHRKKDCKNAIRYHANRLAKLKKSPEKLKDINKKHKSTCPHDKSSKISNKSGLVVKKHTVTKNGHSFSKQSLIAEMKDSLKDHSIDIQKIKLKPEKEQNLSKFENKNINDDKLLNRKNIQTNDKDFSDSKQCNQQSVQNSEDLLPISIDVKPDNIKLSNALPSNSLEVKTEESEDEEELRKIALATFSKRKPDAGLSKKLIKSEDHSKSLEKTESFPFPEINNLESDNYEVVDMDVDEDTEAAIEVFEKPFEGQLSESIENLFVIDNKPFVEDSNRDTVSEVPICNSSDEEFETDILRAELIQSLYRKKSPPEDDEVPKQKQPIVPRKICISNYQKQNKFYHKSLKSKHIVRKFLSKKSQKIPFSSASKLVAPKNQLQISKKPLERLIISVNGESSSEESESEEEKLAPEKSVAPENPVASIEALISDCRQKSESSEKIQEVVAPVSRAVSCLSKAQQEEYQSLKKILAEKEKLPTPAETVQNKNGTTNSALNDLKLLEKKILKSKEDLQKREEYLKLLSKEIHSKNLLYMKSKLSAQRLKEQYLRAEKISKNNFNIWSKSCNQFKNENKTVSILKNKIDQLQKLRCKLVACIQEKTHNSPSLPTNNSNSTI